MKGIAILLLLFVVVVAVTAQSPPSPCYLPPMYTCALFEFVALPGASGFEMNNGIFTISYPAKQARFDVLEGVSLKDGVRDTYVISIFEDFNSKQLIIADPGLQRCMNSSLDYPMGSGQIPTGSTYGGVVMAGTQAVREYFYELSDSKIYYEFGLTEGGCSIFNVNTFNTTFTPQTQMVVETVLNFSPYANPYAFELPCYCNNNPILSISEFPVARQTKIKAALHSLYLRHSLLNTQD